MKKIKIEIDQCQATDDGWCGIDPMAAPANADAGG
jgi:hypothetical protein